MNHPEYLQTLDYRRRLEGLVAAASSTMSEAGFNAFAGSVECELSNLDRKIADYVQGPEGRFASWIGMRTRTFSISEVQKPTPQPVIAGGCHRNDIEIEESVFDNHLPLLQAC